MIYSVRSTTGSLWCLTVWYTPSKGSYKASSVVSTTKVQISPVFLESCCAVSPPGGGVFTSSSKQKGGRNTSLS